MTMHPDGHLAPFRSGYVSDGWRYSDHGFSHAAYRTRPWNIYGDERIYWPVERWNDERWMRIGNGLSYADARRIAAIDSEA